MPGKGQSEIHTSCSTNTQVSLCAIVHCAQAKEGTRIVTEHELELIRKREKELEKSKNELQVLHAVYKVYRNILSKWLNLKCLLCGDQDLLHKCVQTAP